MEFLIAALIAAGFVTFTAHLLGRNRKDEALGTTTPYLLESGEDRQLTNLRPGDVVVHGEEDYFVVAVIACVDGTRQWWEVQTNIDDEARWLRIEKTEPVTLLIGEEISASILGGGDPSENLDHEGNIYRLGVSGQYNATVTRTEEATETPQTPRPQHAQQQPTERHVVAYWNYERDTLHQMWLRRWSDGYHAFVGQRVPSHMVQVLPGD